MRHLRRVSIFIAAALLLPLFTACGGGNQDVTAYLKKVELLKEEIVNETIRWEVGVDPAGAAGHAVFLSVSDGESRAQVYTGTGKSLDEAWEAAHGAAETALMKNGLQPIWVKADVAYLSEEISMEELNTALGAALPGYFHYGLAFDADFDDALLEAELNAAGAYDHASAAVNLENLNAYLKQAGRDTLKRLPDQVTVFRCFGWICDEDNTVHMLESGSLDYGRRRVEAIDDDFTLDLLLDATGFLADQVKEDGSFVYGYDPRTGQTMESYNMVRHANAISSLICRYRLAPDEALAQKIELAIDYMLARLVYENQETAYLYEEKDDEIKLGGCGLAALALTEYMDAFASDKYLEASRHLGNGILALLDQESGVYYHVLNGDFSTKEPYRTVYYDGEATYALCRLYSITGDERFLNGARAAVDHFIEADYTQYKDHWVSYTMNEITRYVTDNPDYYIFALRNVQVNLQSIHDQSTTYHTYLELLMAAFELYDRLMLSGADLGGFELEAFLNTIYTRADRMLSGYFFPEYAMYMAQPRQVLHAFMVRHDNYRVRIDDIQHNIGGYYLYYKNYDRLAAYGLLEARD